MKKFKMALIAVALVGLVLGVQAQGWAALSLGEGEDYDAGLLNNVQFYAVDDTASGDYFLLSLKQMYDAKTKTLSYSFDNSSWTTYTAPVQIGSSTTAGWKQIIFLKLNDDTSGYVNFNTYNRYDYNLDLFNAFSVDFDGANKVELVLAGSPTDKVAPTPIPPAALLLGVGMLGMVSFRKRGGRK